MLHHAATLLEKDGAPLSIKFIDRVAGPNARDAQQK